MRRVLRTRRFRNDLVARRVSRTVLTQREFNVDNKGTIEVKKTSSLSHEDTSSSIDSSDDESSTLERRLASKLIEKLNVKNEQSEGVEVEPKVVVEPEVEVEPEVIVEEATLDHFTEEHKRSLIQAKVDLILKSPIYKDLLEARAAAVHQTALDQAAEAQKQAVERINKIIKFNWKTNLVLKYAQTRPDFNERQEAGQAHFAAIESAIQALIEQTAAKHEADLARRTSLMANSITKSILLMKNAQNMADLTERQSNGAAYLASIQAYKEAEAVAQQTNDEALAKATIEEAIAAEKATAELIRNEIILNGGLKSSILFKNAQIRCEFNERQDFALAMTEQKALEAAKQAAEEETRAAFAEKALADTQEAAEAQKALEAKIATEAKAKKLAMSRTVSQQASGKPKATTRSMKINRKLNSRFAL